MLRKIENILSDDIAFCVFELNAVPNSCGNPFYGLISLESPDIRT